MGKGKGSTVLVTGGAGYIGSQVCRILEGAGHLPVCFDNLSRGHRDAVRWGPLESGDLLDPPALDRAFTCYQPHSVMHFAALAYVGESVTHPLSYYRTNVGGTLNLLEAMGRHGVKRLVFSSSCAVYGIPKSLPISEETARSPVNPYGWSKYFVEEILAQHAASSDLRYLSLRYFNAAGADPGGDLGERHDPETHLIPLVLQAAAGQRPRVDIYGDDYPTPDGTCIRDYVHVHDIAAAHVLALERLLGDGPSGIYNLGASRGISVREIITRAGEITGRPIPVALAPRRSGDPASLVADASRIRADLGWSPEYSDLDTMLRTAWDWHRRHPPAN